MSRYSDWITPVPGVEPVQFRTRVWSAGVAQSPDPWPVPLPPVTADAPHGAPTLVGPGVGGRISSGPAGPAATVVNVGGVVLYDFAPTPFLPPLPPGAIGVEVDGPAQIASTVEVSGGVVGGSQVTHSPPTAVGTESFEAQVLIASHAHWALDGTHLTVEALTPGMMASWYVAGGVPVPGRTVLSQGSWPAPGDEEFAGTFTATTAAESAINLVAVPSHLIWPFGVPAPAVGTGHYRTDVRAPSATAVVARPRYRWVFPVQGTWRLRQRQTLPGADSWPLRQRQNGGATGAWPLRQRQQGL